MTGHEINPAERLHARITGRVQGVGFRYFVQTNAALLNLMGWVRNTWDGAVELTAEGPHEVLIRLLAVVYQGSPSAMVEDIEADWMPATGEFQGFRVKY